MECRFRVYGPWGIFSKVHYCKLSNSLCGDVDMCEVEHKCTHMHHECLHFDHAGTDCSDCGPRDCDDYEE